MFSYSINGADMQERALRLGRMSASLRGEEAPPTLPSKQVVIDWKQGTIDGKVPLASVIEQVYQKYDRDIPASMYSDLMTEWQLTEKWKDILQRSTLEEFLDKYVFWWRDEIPLPILGKRTITEQERKTLTDISFNVFEAAYALKAMFTENPEVTVEKGSEQQKKILDAALGPYLWLSKLLKIEIQKRGAYPDFPTPDNIMQTLKWAAAIGLGLATFTWLKKD